MSCHIITLMALSEIEFLLYLFVDAAAMHLHSISPLLLHRISLPFPPLRSPSPSLPPSLPPPPSLILIHLPPHPPFLPSPTLFPSLIPPLSRSVASKANPFVHSTKTPPRSSWYVRHHDTPIYTCLTLQLSIMIF